MGVPGIDGVNSDGERGEGGTEGADIMELPAASGGRVSSNVRSAG
jgi:hypothetical protein